MILTTTDKIDGYTVEKYLGLVSGTDIYLVGGLLGGGLASQEKLFEAALSNARQHLISKANLLGADAVIGIRQSFTAPGNVNNMILALTGTAVKLIESKETYEDTLPPL
jgi:uncharacterized protein YbjQ (UPF0145 family)